MTRSIHNYDKITKVFLILPVKNFSFLESTHMKKLVRFVFQILKGNGLRQNMHVCTQFAMARSLIKIEGFNFPPTFVRL